MKLRIHELQIDFYKTKLQTFKDMYEVSDSRRKISFPKVLTHICGNFIFFFQKYLRLRTKTHKRIHTKAMKFT